MSLVRFGRWTVRCDVGKTRAAYALTTGCAEQCGCTICKNFVAARDSVYPAEVKRLFEELGIDIQRESEVVHSHRIARGRHSYSGWFYLFGTIESGRDARVPRGDLFALELEAAGDDFSLGFSPRAPSVRAAAPFDSGPIVQIDFAVIAPWVLAIDEPS